MNILVLCTGNSARSILLEMLLGQSGDPRITAYSAGSHPTGQVNPFALRVLDEAGFDTRDCQSKSWDLFTTPSAPKIDLAVTVCGNAEQICPVFTGAPLRAHWGVDDPAAVTGTDEEIEAAFRTTYKQLKTRADAFRELPFEQMDHAALREALNQIGSME